MFFVMLNPADGRILHALQLSPRSSFRHLAAVIGMPEQTDFIEDQPVKGWVAVSETELQGIYSERPEQFRWLTSGRSFLRVGKTIRLYNVR